MLMLPRLLVIVDTAAAERGCGDVVEATVAAADAGATMFQIRLPGGTGRQLYALAELITRELAAYQTIAIVNDRADVAWGLGCHGVHRPQSGLPVSALRRDRAGIVGVSCHNVQELLDADTAGADYATLSPIYPTDSKPAVRPLGTEGLAAAKQLVSMPIFALGGVDPQNVAASLAAGAHGIAVLSGIMAAADPYEATRSYVDAIARVADI